MILPGMPARKILPPMNSDVCDVAHSFPMNQGLHSSEPRMETVLKADHHPQVLFSDNISKLGQTVHSVRDRLFNEEMAIRSSSCERCGNMMTSWIANEGCMRLLSEGVVEIRIALDVIHFFDVVFGRSRIGES